MGEVETLLPCPFCGGEAELRSGSSTTPYIRCKKCGGRTMSSYDIAKLKALWNRRSDDERERMFQANVEKNGEVLRLLKKNAKLCKLVQDYEHCNMHIDCDTCEYDGTASTHCPLSPCFPDTDELYELGVEV